MVYVQLYLAKHQTFFDQPTTAANRFAFVVRKAESPFATILSVNFLGLVQGGDEQAKRGAQFLMGRGGILRQGCLPGF